MKQFILLLLVGSLLAVQPCEAKKKKSRKRAKTTKVVEKKQQKVVDCQNQDGEPVAVSPQIVLPPQTDESSVCFKQVEEMPIYPGGDRGLLNDIAANLQYPAYAAEQGIEGKCVIQFVVTRTGEIGECKVSKSLCTQCDRAAINAIKSLPQKFTPGRADGRAVNVWYTLPITFKLTKDDEETNSESLPPK